MERSGIPGTFIAWPDVLHEGPTPLVSGEEWRQVRARYLSSDTFGVLGEPQEGEVLQRFREADAVLESCAAFDEVVFWFEHDLFDQLLLIRHLWWIGAGAKGADGTPRFSLVCGDQFLGLLKPDEFPALFETRRSITPEQVRIGTRAWEAFCSADPSGLLPFASADHAKLP